LNSIIDELIVLELKCLKPEVRASRDELDKLLAEDFLEIPSTGLAYDKAQALSRIPNEASPIFNLQDFKFRSFSDSLAQLIYKATIQRANEELIFYSVRSSLWQLNGENWQMLFHQGTPCEPFDIKVDEAIKNCAS
jgi:hypothetical protein